MDVHRVEIDQTALRLVYLFKERDVNFSQIQTLKAKKILHGKQSDVVRFYSYRLTLVDMDGNRYLFDLSGKNGLAILDRLKPHIQNFDDL